MRLRGRGKKACLLWLAGVCMNYCCAASFCSDNYLQISFSCLEKGIDFKELLGEYSLSLSLSLSLAPLSPLSLYLSFLCPHSPSPLSSYLCMLSPVCVCSQIQTESASDSTKSQTNKKSSADAETEGGAREHENHQLEVEVMLYRFKQPVAEVRLRRY